MIHPEIFPIMKSHVLPFTMTLVLGILLASCGGKKADTSAEAAEQTTQNQAPASENLPAKLAINEIPLEEVDKMVKMIEADPNWLQQVKDKAAAINVPMVFQLKDDARFFLFEHQAQYGIVSVPEEIVEAEINKIKDNAEWLRSVEQQAKEEGISLEEALRKNALFMIDQRLK